MRSPAFPSARALLGALLLACAPASAALLEGLPGEEVTQTPTAVTSAPVVVVAPPDSAPASNWLAPPVHEQLARDPMLITLGKGALFVPTFSESRREPEIAVFDGSNNLVATGQTGHRILLDPGSYEIRFGSGSSNRRLNAAVKIEEGHTTVVPPQWSGLLVETLTETGEYIDAQYDLISMDHWVNYGRGQGYRDERLQDIDVWILPPGLYRISKTGEGYNSLRNYITVQINPGELQSVELIFDNAVNGSVVAGGIKSLNTHAKAGTHWTYGVRAGGNLGLTRQVDQTDLTRRSALFSTDLRARARYDEPTFFGINEIFLQNSFLKDEGQPFQTTADFVQIQSTWVRRLNSWLGPYVRGQATTHLFPSTVRLDTIYNVRTYTDPGGIPRTDTLSVNTGGSLENTPPLYPLYFAEGAGANIEWLSRYQLELSTQLGLAARQQISDGDYLARTSNSFERARSTYIVGVEGILNAKLRISSAFTLDLLAEVFAEDGRVQKPQIENLQADFEFFITRNVEIGYLFQLSQILDKVANRYPSLNSLSLRLNFNY